MKLSAMNSHYRYYSLNTFFKTISSLGFDACEIWTSPHHFFVDYQQYDDPFALKTHAEHFGLQIIAICPEQTNPKPHNMATGSLEQQNRVYAYFRNMIDIAHTVGAKLVVVTSGWSFYDEPLEAAYQRSVAMMRRLCIYAQEQGILLAIEALQPYESRLVNTVQDLKAYQDAVACENLKICLDLGAMTQAEETIDDYFNVFKEDIVHVHFVDSGHCAWGDGHRNMQEDLMKFNQYKYQGYYSLETAKQCYEAKPGDADLQSLTKYKEQGGI